MKTYIPYGILAWVEIDGMHGPTGNDTIVTSATVLKPHVKVQIGECQEW